MHLGSPNKLNWLSYLEPVRRMVVLGDNVVFGLDGDDGGADGLEDDEDVGREVIVGVLQHQIAGQRAHVTHARVGNLRRNVK